jgi:multiple sugar transport system ATP-binding protein
VVEGQVEVVEPLGGETHLHMDFDGVKLTARSEGSRVIRADERLAVGMNLERLHLFDAENRQAIY